MNLNEAERLAIYLMRAWGIRQTGWRFKYDGAKRRFGSCHYDTKTITLSRHLTQLNSRDEVEDTILHEIAHALTPGDHHGQAWKAACIKVGAKPVRCYDNQVTEPEPNYRGICPRCGQLVSTRYRLTRQTRDEVACRPCYNTTGRSYRLKWVQHSQAETVPKKIKWGAVPMIGELDNGG